MFKRVAHLSVVSLLCLFASACAEGDDEGLTTFGTFGTGPTTQTTFTTVGEENEAGDGDGDETTGDGDPTTTGDGDGDPTTGDGDGDPTTGDGDGDPTTGDGDGDPGPSCGNGVIDPGETCDGNNFGGVTCIDLGFDQGALTCNGCAVSTATCTNSPQPGLGQLYSHCLDNTGCPGLDGCITVTMNGEMIPFDGFCTNICASDAECTANTGGTAVASCNNEDPRYCELDCSGNKTCPGGMECIALTGGFNLCF